jgi:hypothetical protein
MHRFSESIAGTGADGNPTVTLAGWVTAYTAYIWLLDRVSWSSSSSRSLPSSGWTFLGERLSAEMLLGTTLVIGSVFLMWRLERESGARKDAPDMSIVLKNTRFALVQTGTDRVT